METVTVIVRAVLPWDSADGKDRIEICTHDRQSQIDYCLNHCPYAECVNCAGGGRTTSRGGRPPLLREAEMQKLRELLEARTAPAAARARTFPLPESGRGLPGRVPACIWSKYGLSRR